MPGSIFGNDVKRRFLTKANIIAHIEKAIVNNNIDRLTYYISLIDDVNGKYIKRESFLTFICLAGSLEAFNLLVSKGARIDNDLLPTACYGKNIEIVRELIRSKVNVNAKDNDGFTPLLLLMFAPNSDETTLEIFNELIQNGANVNIVYVGKIGNITNKNDNDNRKMLGFSPLIVASERCHTSKIIRELISKGANIDWIDSNGQTALFYAVINNCQENVEILMNANANVNIQNNSGKTTLMKAITESSQGEEAGLDIIKKLMIQRPPPIEPININLQDSDSRTALMFAAQSGSIELVRLLLDAGAHKEIIDNKGNNATSYASNLEIRLLLERLRLEKIWKGWGRGDIEIFDRVFDPDNFDKSHCPVCLKYTEREVGCMYMTHDCASFSQHYNVELYEKYKISNVMRTKSYIQWCTVCGRICQNHYHFSLSPAEGPVPDFQSGNVKTFGDECYPYGGGNEEKAKRYNAIRRKAWEIKDMAGKISDSEAMDQLIIAGWNGPLEPNSVEADLKAQKWLEHPAENFPPQKESTANVFLYPDIEVPAERKMPKLIHGENATTMDEGDVLLFFHPKQTGESYHETINPNSLANKEEFIKQVKKFIHDGEEIEHFGYCFDKQCKAILYPIEVKTALELYGPLSEEETKFYNEYKIKFNEKMRVRKGGAVDSMFVELTDGQCLLPAKTPKTKKGGKTRMKKTRKRKTRRRR